MKVLASLFEDAWRFQHAGDFVEFCDIFAYDRDGRRSEWAYAACGDVAARLRYLFQDDYAGVAVVLRDIRPVAHQPNGQQSALCLPEAKALTLPPRQERT